MATHFNGTENGSPYDLTSDYRVLYASATTFKVNITLSASGQSGNYTAWVLRNGTAIAVWHGGQNHTGSDAQLYFTLAMSPYTIERVYMSAQLLAYFTSPLFSHVTAHETLMLGPTSVAATDYVANSLPLSINECGFVGTFTRFSVQTGVVSGVFETLVTGLNIDGSFDSGSGSQNVDFTFHITSVTVAV